MEYLATSWMALVLGSALALGFYDLFKKDALRDNSVMPVLFLATLSGTLFFIAASLLTGKFASAFACTPLQWQLVMLKTVIVSSSWICIYYAMRDLPISLSAPINASSPLWVLLGGVVFFREVPTLLQLAGMVLVFGSYYVFSVLGGREGFSWRSRGIRLMLLGTMLSAASSLYDKFLLNIQKVPSDTVQLHFSIDIILVLSAALLVRRCCFAAGMHFRWRWSIPLTGIALIFADFFYFRAVALPDGQIAIISLVRRGSCVVTFLAGAWYFGDVNIRRKAAALLVMLLGILLLAPVWSEL